MRRALETLAKMAGRPPVGVRVPSWDFSPTTLGLIRELGLLYDSSLMADDEPYEIWTTASRPGSSSSRWSGSRTTPPISA